MTDYQAEYERENQWGVYHPLTKICKYYETQSAAMKACGELSKASQMSILIFPSNTDNLSEDD